MVSIEKSNCIVSNKVALGFSVCVLAVSRIVTSPGLHFSFYLVSASTQDSSGIFNYSVVENNKYLYCGLPVKIFSISDTSVHCLPLLGLYIKITLVLK